VRRFPVIGSKAKDPHGPGLCFAGEKVVNEVSPVDAQHREAAEPVLIGAAVLVLIVVEALDVIPVGEWA
jgi:hypothetical protein